ncbi:myo-inositol 2-dehydrogenase/D-chiro-inositol 1-dehydrogenase [Cohnella phaseoli]|uniref:Myo-inositol 2-dehydrogenase/D-chiro-inositol 1-dehydrogenase n=2 Tax=Cohnella phaseoli TaxID=456490 RepID=A0A3D9JNS9_9BACL|nr:myo-inositol 2-dehydrogenase/D-chiro-inositol 1-dehydrogenase [Cohnella phaseoli]
MNKAKIGFIGCGTHATNNLYPMLAYTRAELVAVCDLDEQLAHRNAALYGASSVYTDAGRMLDEQQLDGVIIVGPSTVHYSLGMQALTRGIAVFTEKPPAPRLAQAEEMVAVARAGGTFLMTGYMKRHGLPYKKARQLIDSGLFEPAVGHFKYGHWGNDNLNEMLLTMSSHIIDLAISFFGEPIGVTSTIYETGRTISLAAVLHFRSGQWAQLTLDSSQPRIQERVELSGSIDGDNALIVVDNVQQMELHRQGHHGIDLLKPELYEIEPTFDLADIQMWRPDYGIPNMGQTRHFVQGFAGELREFVDAIIERRQPYPGTDDVLKAMRVIDAIAARPNGYSDLQP